MYNLAHSGVPHSNLYPAISLVSISHIELLGLLFLTLNLETKWTRTDKKFIVLVDGLICNGFAFMFLTLFLITETF